MSGVVARFYVSKYEKIAWDKGAVITHLQAVSRGEHNRDWASATPSGTLTMTIKNGPAADFFVECFESGQEIEISLKALPKE